MQKSCRADREEQYETQLEQDGMETIYKYGIACYKKKCRVLRG